MCGEVGDIDCWQRTEQGILYLNPGWRASAGFPNHVVLDLSSMAALRIQETCYIPRVDVLGGRSIPYTLRDDEVPAALGMDS